jgi:hypothetical protein
MAELSRKDGALATEKSGRSFIVDPMRNVRLVPAPRGKTLAAIIWLM